MQKSKISSDNFRIKMTSNPSDPFHSLMAGPARSSRILPAVVSSRQQVLCAGHMTDHCRMRFLYDNENQVTVAKSAHGSYECHRLGQHSRTRLLYLQVWQLWRRRHSIYLNRQATISLIRLSWTLWPQIPRACTPPFDAISPNLFPIMVCEYGKTRLQPQATATLEVEGFKTIAALAAGEPRPTVKMGVQQRSATTWCAS